METITSQTTTKLHRAMMDMFLPTADVLREEGQSDYDIIKIFNDYVKAQQIRFYKRRQAPEAIRHAVDKVLAKKSDAKIEVIYCDLL